MRRAVHGLLLRVVRPRIRSRRAARGADARSCRLVPAITRPHALPSRAGDGRARRDSSRCRARGAHSARRAQPGGALVEYAYEIAVMIETKIDSGDKIYPTAYKSWLGSSVTEYAANGFSFNPLWGGCW